MTATSSAGGMADETSALALCRRFERLYTAAISDVLDEMGYRAQALPPEIVAVSLERTMAGTALTILGEPTDSTDPEVIFVPFLRMLGDVEPGQVLVSQSQDGEAAHFGELSAEAAQRRGGRGAVIDGGCRDVERIRRLRFPVFARYLTPRDLVGRWRLVAHNVPVRIGGVAIAPGDVVVGDGDGVLIVPRPIATTVLQRAEAVAATEDTVRQAILSGMPPLAAYRRFSRF